MGALIEKLRIDLHEHLHGIVNHAVDGSVIMSVECNIFWVPKTSIPVPVTLGVLEEGREHDRQNGLDVVANQVTEVLIVPEIEGAFGDLYKELEPMLSRYSKVTRTWKCGLATDLASCWKSGSWTLANSAGSMTSKISSTSFKNMTSFVLLTLGQYRNNPRTT